MTPSKARYTQHRDTGQMFLLLLDSNGYYCGVRGLVVEKLQSAMSTWGSESFQNSPEILTWATRQIWTDHALYSVLPHKNASLLVLLLEDRYPAAAKDQAL